MVDFIAFDSCINQKYRSVNVFSSRHISTVIDNKVCLCSFAGTYCGVLPSDVETTLTLVDTGIQRKAERAGKVKRYLPSA